MIQFDHSRKQFRLSMNLLLPFRALIVFYLLLIYWFTVSYSPPTSISPSHSSISYSTIFFLTTSNFYSAYIYISVLTCLTFIILYIHPMTSFCSQLIVSAIMQRCIELWLSFYTSTNSMFLSPWWWVYRLYKRRACSIGIISSASEWMINVEVVDGKQGIKSRLEKWSSLNDIEGQQEEQNMQERLAIGEWRIKPRRGQREEREVAGQLPREKPQTITLDIGRLIQASASQMSSAIISSPTSLLELSPQPVQSNMTNSTPSSCFARPVINFIESPMSDAFPCAYRMVHFGTVGDVCDRDVWDRDVCDRYVFDLQTSYGVMRRTGTE